MQHLFGYFTEQVHISKEQKKSSQNLNPIQQGRGEESEPTSLSLPISAKVEISPKNFLTFSVKSFANY